MNNDTDKRHIFSLLFPLLGNGWIHLILDFALSITGSSITSTGGLKTYINKNNQHPLFSLNRVERGIGWRKKAVAVGFEILYVFKIEIRVRSQKQGCHLLDS